MYGAIKAVCLDASDSVLAVGLVNQTGSFSKLCKLHVIKCTVQQSDLLVALYICNANHRKPKTFVQQVIVTLLRCREANTSACNNKM